jgi:hypothetical protein
LQIIKRFRKKEKGFSIYSGCEPKLSWKPSLAWPGQPLLSSPLPRGPAEAERPSRPPYPVRACSLVRPRGLPKPRQFPSSQGLGHAELTPRHRLPATELTPCPRLGCLCLVPRSCLPQTPPQRPTSFLRTATTESKQRIYPQRIVKSSTNSQRMHYESSIRLEEISGTLFRSCWTPWPTNRSTQAPP